MPGLETRLGDEQRGDLPLLSETEIAERESLNGIRQFDRMLEFIRDYVDGSEPFKFLPSMLVELNALAVEGLEPVPGAYRTGPVFIGSSKHIPPDWRDVPVLVEAMCDYVNRLWTSATALHLAAYCMWRVNWIHPFVNGNGRTSRAVSYLVLCIHSGVLLPGRPTIPETIAVDRAAYYRALEKADKAARYGRVDVTAMERLLGAHLATQLESSFS